MWQRLWEASVVTGPVCVVRVPCWYFLVFRGSSVRLRSSTPLAAKIWQCYRASSESVFISLYIPWPEARSQRERAWMSPQSGLKIFKHLQHLHLCTKRRLSTNEMQLSFSVSVVCSVNYLPFYTPEVVHATPDVFRTPRDQTPVLVSKHRHPLEHDVTNATMLSSVA